MPTLENVTEYLPHRHETRYEIPQSLAEKALQLFSTHFEQEKHSNEWTRTLYFTAMDFAAPTGQVIRARRYDENPLGDVLDLSLDEDWYMELKAGSGHKSRRKMPLGEILLTTSYPEAYSITDHLPHASTGITSAPQLPVAATESLRTHFVDDSTRITVDQNMRYFGFEWGSLTGYAIGQNPTAKIETKKFSEQNGEILTNDTAHNKLLAQLGAAALPEGTQEATLRRFYKEFLQNHA